MKEEEEEEDVVVDVEFCKTVALAVDVTRKCPLSLSFS